MPAAQVELDHGDEPFNGVVNFRNGQQHLRVAHEAANCSLTVMSLIELWKTVLGNPFQHTARLQDERGKNHSAEIGAGPQLGYDMGQDWIGTGVSACILANRLQPRGAVLTNHFPGRAQQRGYHLQYFRFHRRRIDCLEFGESYVSICEFTDGMP